MEMSGPCLLVCTLTLWILFTAMPVFESKLPQITLPWNWRGQHVTFPSAEIVTLFVALFFYLSAYCLLVQRSGMRLSLKKNLLFNLFGYMIIYGSGIHAAVVMTEEKAKLPGNAMSLSLAACIDFVHEIVAHNMFVGCFLALQMLIIFEEKANFLYKLGKKVEGDENCDTSVSRFSSKVKLRLQGVMFEWVFPVILGVYFPVFSSQTHTVAIVTGFYLLVMIHSALTWSQLSNTVCRGAMCSLLGNDLMMWGTVLKASCVGLPITILSFASVNLLLNSFLD